jgi:hypothetical protein
MRAVLTNSAAAVSHRSRRIMTAMVAAIALAALVFPLLWNRVPPLLDYAGNLARVDIMHELMHGTGFADTYRFHVAIVPNLAIDGIGLALMELGLPVEAAGHGFLVLTFLLLGLGVLGLHQANFRRFAIWPYIAIPFLVQESSLWGFMNYLFSLGIGLCSVALWRQMRRDHPVIGGLVLIVTSLLVFLSHLAGFLVAAGVVVGTEVAELAGPLVAPGARPNRSLSTALIGTVACLLPFLLLAAAPMMASHAPSGGAFAQQLQLAMLKQRVARLFGFIWAYDDTLDIISLGCVAALLVLGVVTRTLRICWPMLLPIAGLLAIYLVIPDGWFGTQSLPDRLPIALFLLAVSAVDLQCEANWQFGTIAGAVAVLALLRGLAVNQAWEAANRSLAPLLATLESLPEGSRIYSALAYKGDFIFSPAVMYYGAPGYLVMHRHGFYPHAFASPEQNVVAPQSVFADAPRMPRNFRVDRPHPSGPDDDPYSADRLGFYDYALIVEPNDWPEKPPPGLAPVSSGADYVLLRIDKTMYPRR